MTVTSYFVIAGFICFCVIVYIMQQLRNKLKVDLDRAKKEIDILNNYYYQRSKNVK
jgi:hypothetical protein